MFKIDRMMSFANPNKSNGFTINDNINILITRMKQLTGKVNSNDISTFAIKVLNNYIKESMSYKK